MTGSRVQGPRFRGLGAIPDMQCMLASGMRFFPRDDVPMFSSASLLFRASHPNIPRLLFTYSTFVAGYAAHGLFMRYTVYIGIHVFVFFFPTLTVGLLDFKVNVVLARCLGYSCTAPPPRIPAVPNRRASLQCLTAKYPCSAEPPSILAVPNRRASLQCQPQSVPAVPNHQVSLQCPTAEYPCSAQAPSIPAVPNH